MELEKIVRIWVDLKHEESKDVFEGSTVSAEKDYPEKLRAALEDFAAKSEDAGRCLGKTLDIVRDLVVQTIISQRDKVSFFGEMSRDEIKEVVGITDQQLTDNIEEIWDYGDSDKQCFKKITDIMEGCCY